MSEWFPLVPNYLCNVTFLSWASLFANWRTTVEPFFGHDGRNYYVGAAVVEWLMVLDYEG